MVLATVHFIISTAPAPTILPTTAGVTSDFIAPTIAAVVILVIAFPAVVVLLFLVFHYSHKHDKTIRHKIGEHVQLRRVETTTQQDEIDRQCKEIAQLKTKVDGLERQVSSQSETQDSGPPACCKNKVAKVFFEFGNNIDKASPDDLKPVLYLEAVRGVVEIMIKNVKGKCADFQNLLLKVQEDASRLWRELAQDDYPQDSDPIPKGRVSPTDSNQPLSSHENQRTELDGVRMSYNEEQKEAREKFRRALDQLNQLVKKDSHQSD